MRSRWLSAGLSAWLTLALVVALLTVSGCRSEPPRQGITVLLESPADSLDDRFATSGNGSRIAQLIAPGLLTFDDQSRAVPDLAESFQQVSPTELLVTLRPNLTFHDGTRLTSRSVVATFEGLMDPQLGSPKRDHFEVISKIEAIDERTVRFVLKRPFAPFLAELTISIVPESRARMPGAQAQDRTPIGAGPFRVDVSEPERTELVPFDGYYAGKPAISRLVFRVVRDETTRVLELLKGRADLVINAISPAVLPAVRKDGHLRVESQPGTGYAYLALNVRTGPTADVRVRRALCDGIDVREIVEHKFHGLAIPASGMLPKNHWAYAETGGCHRNLDQAAKLLDAAGYPLPRDGKSPRFTLTLKTSTDRFRKSVALLLKEQLAGVGVNVEVRSLEFGTFYNDVKRGNFELAAMKWAAVIEPDLLRQVFTSRYIPSEANQFIGFNRGGYSNPDVDAVLEQATRVVQPERVPLYAKALAEIDRDLPYLPLWHESTFAVVSDRLQDFHPSAHGFFRPLAFAREVAR